LFEEAVQCWNNFMNFSYHSLFLLNISFFFEQLGEEFNLI
jgi:hypothetical protein